MQVLELYVSMETLNKILRSMMEFYGLDPETYHSEVINHDEPARMKKKKKNKSPFKGKSQCFVEEASENEADLEVPNNSVYRTMDEWDK